MQAEAHSKKNLLTRRSTVAGAQSACRSAVLAVAPMMACTDRHCRYFHRLMSKHVRLYTEMISAAAILHGNARQLLAFDPLEHPVAVQIGGADCAQLRNASILAAQAGYDEINFNVGCPSPKVGAACFGAVLMTRPQHAADCVSAMMDGAGQVPVSVKCRIGVDEDDPETRLPEFVEHMQNVGVRRIAIHARKAILTGLSPKQNRNVPPLDYPLVLRIKEQYPAMEIYINGGIDSLDLALALVAQGADGAMIGRAAYDRPGDILLNADWRLRGIRTQCSREDIVEKMIPYIERQMAAGIEPHCITRHMLGLFSGRPGARLWRRKLSEISRNSADGLAWVARIRDRMMPAA